MRALATVPFIVEGSKVGQHGVYLVDPPPLKQPSVIPALLLEQEPSQLLIVHREEVLQVPRHQLHTNQRHIAYTIIA